MKRIIISEQQMSSILLEMLNEVSLEDIYNKYYSNIDLEIFNQIIQADPTYRNGKMGKYGKWLLSLYQRGGLKIEDLYKATQYISTFVKFYNKIKQKDINKYPSLPSLYQAVKPFLDNPDQATSKSDEIRQMKQNGAEKVYEDDEWLIVVPHTQEAAIYYGKNTEWCTAAEHSDNQFDYYNGIGKLYININKKTNHKWQFHFETCSFMDETDSPIIESDYETYKIADEIGLSEGAADFYRNVVGVPVNMDDTLRNDIFEKCYTSPYDYYEFGDYDYSEEDLEEAAQYKFEETLSENGYEGYLSLYISEPSILGIVRIGGKSNVLTKDETLLFNEWYDTVNKKINMPYLEVSDKKYGANIYSIEKKKFLFPQGMFSRLIIPEKNIIVATSNDKSMLFDLNTIKPISPSHNFIKLLNPYYYEYRDGNTPQDYRINFAKIGVDEPILPFDMDSLGFFGNNRITDANRRTVELIHVGKGNFDGYADIEGNLYTRTHPIRIITPEEAMKEANKKFAWQR